VPGEFTFLDEVKVFLSHFKKELTRELKEVSNWEGEGGLDWAGILTVAIAPILVLVFVLIIVCFKDVPTNSRKQEEIKAEKNASLKKKKTN